MYFTYWPKTIFWWEPFMIGASVHLSDHPGLLLGAAVDVAAVVPVAPTVLEVVAEILGIAPLRL